MTALDYLKQLPAVWINLERSPDRAEQFERMTAPLFAASYRMVAYDGLLHYDPDTAAFAWRDGVKRTLETSAWWKEFGKPVTNFQAGNKYLNAQRKARELYACTLAVFYSHQAAIKMGYDTGWDRFMVLEDDAIPRSDAMSRLEAPSASHFNVWGGAIPMAGHKSDNRMFNEGKKMGWVDLPKGNKLDKLYCATAYELTHDAAGIMLGHMSENPLPFDISWWYAMDAVGGQRLVPTGFIQTGVSERSGSTRRLGATDSVVQP